jgi:hypothetical protein
LTSGAGKLVAPHVLSVTHWNRILDGELYAPSSRVDWRTLLKRTSEHDLRVCVRCQPQRNGRPFEFERRSETFAGEASPNPLSNRRCRGDRRLIKGFALELA